MAALLISRQVIGNLKESALPYILEHMRFAKMSFDLWGALSPTNEQPPNQPDEIKLPENTGSVQADQPSSAKRSMSQAELESSLFKVIYCIVLFEINYTIV